MLKRSAATFLLAAWVALAAGCEYLNRKVAVNHYVQGQLLIDKGDLDAALAELERSIQADPNLAVAHASIGDIHRRRGDHEAAVNAYETSCQANPYAFRPHYNLGVTYQLLAEAAKTVDKAQGYLREAIRVYLRAVTLRPEDFDAVLNLSVCYFQLGKMGLAEEYCKTAIQLKPDGPHAYSNLGIIYDALGRDEDAVIAYKNSLERDMHQSVILVNLGCTYVRQGRLKLAIKIFEMASKEAPDDSLPWVQMGSCHYHLKDYDQSLECYRKAADLNAKNPDAHRGLGIVYMSQYLLDQTKTQLRDKALQEWNASLELLPAQKDLMALVQKYTPKPTGPS
jgi:Flp pilus assembly protein TadD